MDYDKDIQRIPLFHELNLNNGCAFLSMPGLKLNHVSKMGPGIVTEPMPTKLYDTINHH